jgi:type II secretory ATPase GspE/PulE/Tfp pilus assembly ATPase PilB-like protein/nucleotide-binding universal stress UspA family protein
MNTTKPKILFPTDYSPCSRAALKHAIELARATNSCLLAAYVAPPDISYMGIPPSSADQDGIQEPARLASLVEGSLDDAPLEYEHQVLVGDPATEILELARREAASLIVMGTTGHSGLRRMLLGSVADAIVRHAPCPVLTLSQTAANGAATPAKLPVAFSQPDFAAPAPSSEAPLAAHAEIAAPHASAALDLVKRAVTARATDIHIDPADAEYEVRLRIDGRLRHFCRLSSSVGHSLLTQFKVLGDLDIADPFHSQEGRLKLPDALAGYEGRIATLPVVGGEALSLRLLDRDRLMRPLGELGLTDESLDQVHRMLQLGAGLVVATGPSGSGKTTMIYSMLHALDDGERNIVSIEDPVEYHVPGFRQINVDLKHRLTMASGLRSMLRLDPDVVLVGEIRDPEAAEIAMRAASSGKYVFTTFHTRDVASMVTAFRDLSIDNRSLAGNLTGIISSRLVRRVCRECCRQEAPTREEAELFAAHGVEPPATVSRAVGCGHCHGVGYRDRIGVFEVALPTAGLVDEIVRGLPETELRAALRSAGTRSLLADALTKVRDGITTLEEVREMTWLEPARKGVERGE